MVAYWLLLLGRKLACILPGACIRFLGSCLGAAGYYLDLRHRRIALANLRMAFPSLDRAARRRLALSSFARLGLNFVELLRLPVFTRPGWERAFTVEGREHLQKALGRGKGVIFVLAHFGNWEYLALVPRLLSFRGGAVVQKIKNPAIDGLVREMREEAGLVLFSKREVAGQLADYLAENGAVAILADQRARRMAVEVDFFGRPAPTTAAPAVLAWKTSAALIPVFIYPEKFGKFRVVFEPEIELPPGMSFRRAVRELTRRFTAIFEQRISRNPELWFWVHRRWGKGI